jgi:glycosyltransferase involved in cell wall biosynthesis
VRASSGEWIVFLDADDWLLPASIASRLAALTEFPEATWISGDFDEVLRDGTLLPHGRFERNLESYWFLKPAYETPSKPVLLRRPLRDFLANAPTNTICGLLKRDSFLSLGGYSAELLRQQDYHLFLRLAASNDFVFIPMKVARVRHHANNSTKSITETQSWRVSALSSLRNLPEFQLYRNELTAKIASLHIDNSYHHRRDGCFWRATVEASRALRQHPLSRSAWRSLGASVLRRN